MGKSLGTLGYLELLGTLGDLGCLGTLGTLGILGTLGVLGVLDVLGVLGTHYTLMKLYQAHCPLPQGHIPSERPLSWKPLRFLLRLHFRLYIHNK